MSALYERVSVALEREPLCRISAAARAELNEVLAGADALEDLPGKWQAAILTAESAEPGASHGHCCGGAHGHA